MTAALYGNLARLANFLLVGLLAYWLALVAGDIARLRLASWDRPAAGPAQAHGLLAAAARPRAYYDPIVSRDIFHLVAKAAAAAGPAPRPQVQLLGVSELTFAPPFVVVEDLNTREQALYRLGDFIPDAGTLVAIAKDRATVEKDRQRFVLELPSQNAAQGGPQRGGPPARAARASDQGIRQMGADRYVVPRATLDRNIRDMAQLFTQARAIPSFENGRPVGFLLTEIQPDSVFQQLGLRNGDVLTSVEGENVSNPAKALAMLSELSTRNSIRLEVRRNGQPTELQYLIR